MATPQNLRDLRSQQVNLTRQREAFTRQREEKFAEYSAAVARLADGDQAAQSAVAAARSAIDAIDDALGVIAGRLTEVAGAIGPLEVALGRERRLQQLRTLGDRVIAVRAELMEQREQASERVSVLINETFGTAAGFGGRLEELHVLLDQLRDATRALSSDRRDDFGVLAELLELPADSRLRTAVKTALPGRYNAYSREFQLDELPDLGIGGSVLDRLAESLRPANAEERRQLEATR